MHDIIDTAVAAGTFKTLAAAVTAAKLAETLKGAGPFTVFGESTGVRTDIACTDGVIHVVNSVLLPA